MKPLVIYLSLLQMKWRFNSEAFVKKTSNEKNGVLYHRGQILEGQQFILAGGFEDLNILND